jgi:hypothetical protein
MVGKAHMRLNISVSVSVSASVSACKRYVGKEPMQLKVAEGQQLAESRRKEYCWHLCIVHGTSASPLVNMLYTKNPCPKYYSLPLLS